LSEAKDLRSFASLRMTVENGHCSRWPEAIQRTAVNLSVFR